MVDQQSLRSACAYAQSDQSLCWPLEYSMTIKLLTEQHLEFLSLKDGCTGSSESTLVKMPHCWKSHVTAHLLMEVSMYTLIATGLVIRLKQPAQEWCDMITDCGDKAANNESYIIYKHNIMIKKITV